MNATNEFDFAALFKAAGERLDYHVEGAILQFTEDACGRMAELGVNRADLAREMNVQPAYVTKLLSGQNNFTLRTMVKVARALKTNLKVGLEVSPLAGEWTAPVIIKQEFLAEGREHHSAIQDAYSSTAQSLSVNVRCTN